MVSDRNIGFQRGLDPKKGLDVGVKRSENLKQFIEGGIEKYLSTEFVTCKRGDQREDGSYKWVEFFNKGPYEPSGYIFKHLTIYINCYSTWNIYQLEKLKNKAVKWLKDNGYNDVDSKYDHHLDTYIIQFEEE